MKSLLLILVTSVVAAAAGIATARVAEATHIQYQVWITAPTGAPNTYVDATCGWHVYCLPPYPVGHGVDWIGPYPFNVYFRGGFRRASTPFTSGNYLTSARFTAGTGPDVCDELVSDLYENSSGKVRLGMHYVHAHAQSEYWQPVYVNDGATGFFGHYAMTSFLLNSDGGCQWQGAHVHDIIVLPSANPSSYLKQSLIPTAPGGYDEWGNGNWTRYVTWQENAP